MGRQRLTLEQMQTYAKERGGVCLSTSYVDTKTKLRWRCAEGHEWEAKPNRILNGTWCPHCAGNVPLTIEQMQALAKERGGACLSTAYVNSGTKLRWQCAEGHEWEARPRDVIHHPSWCPTCSRTKRDSI